MRAAYLLLTASALSSVGCSALIANSGQNLAELTTQEQVHRTFGPPAATGQADGQPFEEFTTRRKIAEPDQNIYLAMGYSVTLGLGELYWFPQQLCVAGRRSIVGQHLRFMYDESGNVTGIRHDGEAVLGVGASVE